MYKRQVVEFAKKFHDETFIKDDKSFFTTYMETTTGDRNTLAHVDLTSDVYKRQMVVLEKALKAVHEELDMVTTPSGDAVAMVHCNNCTSDLNAWGQQAGSESESSGSFPDLNGASECTGRCLF